jgi:hypothetical protein
MLLLCGAVARAGSYLFKNTARLCPKGTYTNSLNSASACTRCTPGVTTLAEGSSSEAACDRAIKGYKYTGPNTAEHCDLNTYNDEESTDNLCTPCPFGKCAGWPTIEWFIHEMFADATCAQRTGRCHVQCTGCNGSSLLLPSCDVDVAASFG